MMKRSMIVVLTLAFGMNARAQRENIVREQTGANVVQYEYHYVSRDSTNSVMIPFRVRYDFFVFTRTIALGNEVFTALGEVTVELLDSTGTSVARNIQQISLTTQENAPSSLRSQFTQKLFSFTVPYGRYTLVVKLEDKESKRQFVDDKKSFVIPKQNNSLSGLIPVQNHTGQIFTLFNIGGDILFSQNYGFVFVSKKKYSSAVYTLTKLQMDDEDNEPIAANVPVSVESFENQTITATMSTDHSVVVSSQSGEQSNINYITFDGYQLRQGRYEITLSFPDSTKLKATFGARWNDMPNSLNDLDLATEPLQFITTKDEYSDLRKGGRETRIKKFEDFWKKKDATPFTAYNEVMHEFYRRVDYSMTAFRSLKEMNGAITDRGRIYLLYGKPSSTERLLNPDGAPKEIWKYNSLNKIFTFEDPSKQGNYKLAENK